MARTGRPGPGAHRHLQGRPDRHGRVRLPGRRAPARLPPAAARARASWCEQAAASSSTPPSQPVILAGHGIVLAGAYDELSELAETGDIPVVTTLLGIGTLPESHRLNLGMVGMHGHAWANQAVQNADLLVALGMRFDDRFTGNLKHFAPQRRGDPRGHRPGGDRQERAGGRGHRGRRQARPAAAAAADRRPAIGPTGCGRSLTGARESEERDILKSDAARRSLLAALRDPRDLAGDRRQRPDRHRRGPAPDVGGPVLPLRPARTSSSPPAGWAPWASRWARPWAPRWAGPTRRSGSSSATAASRCACMELATLVQEGVEPQDRRDRTTATWAWCASGRS